MGLAVGLLAGVAVGLLLAPTPGTELRTRLRSRAQDALGRARTYLHGDDEPYSVSDPFTDDLAETTPVSLTATLGELANMHSLANDEGSVRS